MTPGAHIEVLVRGEWIAVEVTHVPTEDAAAYLGRCRDGELLAWTADVETRPRSSTLPDCDHDECRAACRETVVDGVVFTAAERERYRSFRVAGLEGAVLGYRMRALLAEDTAASNALRADLAEMNVTIVCNCCDRLSATNDELSAQHASIRAAAEAVHTDRTRHAECVFGDAMRAWIAAGRPGAGEEG